LAKIIRNTYSLCPSCLKRLPAEIVKIEQEYFIEKTCPDHGRFSTVVWRGENPSFEQWGNYVPPLEPETSKPACPTGCGLCPSHLQKTCCVLIEVTHRCNLSCPICFAQSDELSADPEVKQLSEYFEHLVKIGNTFIQLSGGEPTVRDDLPEIIAAARAAGCENIQLNSNGIRLGKDRAYAKALADAGLSFVFMQFDGTADAIYERLRGRPLLDEKLSAIRVCADHGVGVTLVATIVPGINDQNIGEILNFGFSNSPAVRGVHFQPVSYFGRYPHPPQNEDRITLPEIVRAIEHQTAGKIKAADFVPSGCDHPRCGFHGDFVILPDRLIKLTKQHKPCCGEADNSNAHLKNRNFVARRWKRPLQSSIEADCCNKDYQEMDHFLERIKSHGFTITAMAFQDAYTLDIERLRRCSLHAYSDGKLVPFCIQYLTTIQNGDIRHDE
jgi:uncharacterized radical SAM superfamily Fe-S cluster-containing enzyme